MVDSSEKAISDIPTEIITTVTLTRGLKMVTEACKKATEHFIREIGERE